MTDFTERLSAALFSAAQPGAVSSVQTVGGQHGYRHLVATLADGRQLFVKAAGEAADDPSQAEAFAAEANSLRWLGEADGGVPVPDVVAVAGDLLAIEFLPPGRPTAEAAEDFGAALARTHRAGAPYFGADWPGRIASLPLDNTPTRSASASDPPGAEWGQWWQERRGVRYTRRARDAGLLSAADLSLVETVVSRAHDLGGPAEPPSRIHGDLWSGNVLWSGGRGWLIDPAAHGGHRESDLAMLHLFGAPYLDRIVGAYDTEFPLADGWRSRIPLHQIHPLLVHVCLFGGAYAGQLREAARAALAA
ncbi:MAG TPA: fructosamine kinase family protein [Trebonia sp.]|nr:fructosamine kinase family protein [Trebonia sp.]